MNNENLTEETVASIDGLKTKFKNLPWKKIAAGAAVATATVALVAFSKKSFEDQILENQQKEAVELADEAAAMNTITD